MKVGSLDVDNNVCDHYRLVPACGALVVHVKYAILENKGQPMVNGCVSARSTRSLSTTIHAEKGTHFHTAFDRLLYLVKVSSDLTLSSMLPLIPSDPGCPFVGRVREAF